MRTFRLFPLITFFAMGSSAEAQPPGSKPPSEKVMVKTIPQQMKSRSSIPHDFAKWEKEIAAYEEADRKSPPPKGGVLFIGSSTIRLWKTMATDFPNHKVINRGFGGSEIADSTHFAERIIFPYEPRQIFLRAGGNDINAGRLPREVAEDFRDFVRKVHVKLPKTEIYYIEVSPAPQRWGQNDKYKSLNARIREMAIDMPRVAVVDAFDMSLNSDGSAVHGFFVPDMLHFNELGYVELAKRVRPYLHHVSEKKAVK